MLKRVAAPITGNGKPSHDIVILFYIFFRSIIFILYIFSIFNLFFYRQNLFLVFPLEFYAIYCLGEEFPNIKYHHVKHEPVYLYLGELSLVWELSVKMSSWLGFKTKVFLGYDQNWYYYY